MNETVKEERGGKVLMENYFESVTKAISEPPLCALQQICESIKKIKETGSKIIIAGNGGSAAIASHLSVDFTKYAKIRAVNFNEADLITCFANDYGYENWIKEALVAYCDPADIIILISSSGRSSNMLTAANWAKQENISLITATGFAEDNPLRLLGDVNVWVNSNNYNVIEMAHHIWLLGVVEQIGGEYAIS
jgi:D-sedoheptulose 7-phosphate isomerase